jgi:hypothetical protein
VPSPTAITDPTVAPAPIEDLFIGREPELRALDAAAQSVRAGHGQVVVVRAAAGMGKTRFCEEAAARARAAGMTVVWGRCWSGGGAPALWPWQPVLTELCGREAAGLLDHDRGTEVVDPERFTRFSAVVDRLADAPGPVFLVLDDLHAADPGAVLLTRFVARMRHRLPILLVITVRDPGSDPPGRDSAEGGRADHRLLADLIREGSQLALTRFTLRDTRALLAGQGMAVDEPDTLAAVHRITGGNPLHLRRLLAVGLGRRLTDVGGLRSLVDESVAQVRPATRAVLAVAAVLGPAGSIAQTAAIADRAAGDVLDALDEAAAVGLVVRRAPEAFEFSHDLVREQLVASLSGRQRLDVHARARDTLDDGGATTSNTRLARRAHHAVAAAARSPVDARVAVEAGRAAAGSMVSRFDYEQAAGLLETAAALHEHAGLGPLPAGLLLEWAQAVLCGGRLAEARELFDAAAAMAQLEAEPVLAARAALGLGGTWVNEHRDRAERERVLALQRAALAALGDDPDLDRAGLRCRLRVRLAAEAVYSGEPLDAVLAALEQARRFGDRQVLAEALSLTHHALLRPDHVVQRLALAEELVAVASAAGDGVLVLMGLCWRAVDLFHLGDGEAERALAELHARSDALNCRSILYVASVLRVMTAIRRGDLAAAEQAAAQSHQLGVEVGDADAFGYYAAQLVGIRWMQGRAAEMVDLVAEAAASPSLVRSEFAFRATLARFAADAGQLTRARQALDQLTGAGLSALPQSSTWLTGMTAIVETAAALSDAELARQAYSLLLPFAELPIMPSLAVVCFGSTHRPLGLAALTGGDVETAIRHLRQALAVDLRLGNRPLAACTRADLASALIRRGSADDRRQAGELLALAIEEARAMGLTERVRQWQSVWDGIRRGGEHRVVFRSEAGRWRIGYAGRDILVEDLLGVRYLARLTARPEQSISALDLVGAGTVEGSRQELVDATARSAYRRRARELLAELDDARSDGDPDRIEQLESEAGALLSELEQGTGRGGRSRTFSGPAERARTAVRKAIKRAIDTIETADADLARELRATVSTGYSCRYEPRLHLGAEAPVRRTVASRR